MITTNLADSWKMILQLQFNSLLMCPNLAENV